MRPPVPGRRAAAATLFRGLAAAGLLGGGWPVRRARAAEEAYPGGPVTVVNPYGAGGFGDISSRITCEELAAELRQPFIVDVRPGASGSIGTAYVAKAPPNGYTLLVVSTSNLIVGPLLQPGHRSRLPDFVPIGLAAEAPILLAVGSDSPYRSFAAFRDAALREPGRLSISHAGDGTSNHLAILHLQKVLGTRFNPVPYKSPGQGLMDLMGGRIDAGVNQLSSSLSNLQAGKIRPLLTFTPERLAQFPEVPTLRELGLADFPFAATMGLAAPAHTPPAVVERLSAAMQAVLARPQVRERFDRGGMVVRYMGPGPFLKALEEQQQIITELIRAGALKQET